MPQADFVVVANRLPVDRVTDPDGEHSWRRSPGGLVTALEPVMRRAEGAWVGWPGQPDLELEPFDFDGTHLVPISLSAEDVELYYEGFSNDTIWPLYHDVIAEPRYSRPWWDAYVRVNRRFAEAAASALAENGTVWVQDYQLQLVPKLIRELRPDATIGYFHHIPFPAYGLFSQLPWRRQVLEGLLGADVIGFQRVADAGNFARAVRRQLRFETKASGITVPLADGTTRVARARAFPISIDAASYVELARKPEVRARAAEIRESLGNPKKILLGVDRLDYTKGIGHRLKAYGELLAEGRLNVEDVTLVQVASPSRERVEAYMSAARRDRADREPHQRRRRHDGPLGDPLPAPGLPPRGDGRAVPRRRRDARHGPPRRHEPRREGVRRDAHRQPRGARAERVHRSLRRAGQRAPHQSRTTSRASRTRSCARSRCPVRNRGAGCGPSAAGCSSTTSTPGRATSCGRSSGPGARMRRRRRHDDLGTRRHGAGDDTTLEDTALDQTTVDAVRRIAASEKLLDRARLRRHARAPRGRADARPGAARGRSRRSTRLTALPDTTVAFVSGRSSPTCS